MDDIMVILNAHWEEKIFKLPPASRNAIWERILDTSLPAGQDILELDATYKLNDQNNYTIAPRSCIVLRRKN